MSDVEGGFTPSTLSQRSAKERIEDASPSGFKVDITSEKLELAQELIDFGYRGQITNTLLDIAKHEKERGRDLEDFVNKQLSNMSTTVVPGVINRLGIKPTKDNIEAIEEISQVMAPPEQISLEMIMRYNVIKRGKNSTQRLREFIKVLPREEKRSQ